MVEMVQDVYCHQDVTVFVFKLSSLLKTQPVAGLKS